MNYELEELLEENDIDAIGEYLSCYGKEYWNNRYRCFIVHNRRFYPIFDEDGNIITVEED